MAERGAISRRLEARKLSKSPKFGKVLKEAKAGTLRTSAGTKPTGRKQELAIAFSEARRA